MWGVSQCFIICMYKTSLSLLKEGCIVLVKDFLYFCYRCTQFTQLWNWNPMTYLYFIALKCLNFNNVRWNQETWDYYLGCCFVNHARYHWRNVIVSSYLKGPQQGSSPKEVSKNAVKGVHSAHSPLTLKSHTVKSILCIHQPRRILPTVPAELLWDVLSTWPMFVCICCSALESAVHWDKGPWDQHQTLLRQIPSACSCVYSAAAAAG